MERYEGQPVLAVGLALVGAFLLALVGWVVVQAFPQFPGFGPATIAAGVVELGGMAAAGLFLLHGAGLAAASFRLDDRGITRRAWGQETSLAWAELVRVDEVNTVRLKGGVGTMGRLVLRAADGRRVVILCTFLADPAGLLACLGPRLAPLREAERAELARGGRRFRPGRGVGYLVLTTVVPLFLVAGWAVFEPAGRAPFTPDSGVSALGLFALAAAPVLALLGVEWVSRELTVTPHTLALRSLLLDRVFPFDCIASVTVRSAHGKECDTETVTVRADDGRSIAFDSSMPGYRALIDLIVSRSGVAPNIAPAIDPDLA